ncbi:GPI mannosyltransferase 2 [Caligus rogercresseyi]|uniref:GPI mannosyltransferase 2 n=1 Tax=Caligus rogercresseyi TaxID=217165 RepID=A0A7T8JTT6_CALRO|nr:GPI mannosyltransferase 2 [Caligus rogercresseyi]QQP33096.1 GPI mannosyltransferase 2 [Caligus rogercresseyi]
MPTPKASAAADESLGTLSSEQKRRPPTSQKLSDESINNNNNNNNNNHDHPPIKDEDYTMDWNGDDPNDPEWGTEPASNNNNNNNNTTSSSSSNNRPKRGRRSNDGSPTNQDPFSAVFSRLFILSLSFVSNVLIPDHDAYDVFKWIKVPLDSETNNVAEEEEEALTGGGPKPLDAVLSALFDGLSKWDGQHFLHIANNGYTYEKSIAFFPLFPQIVYLGGHFIHWCQIEYDLLSYSVCLLLASTIINFICFVLAALVLFELSRKVLKDEYLAYKASLFFCINPASIFFSAAYSESLYSLTSFYAMLKIERSFKLQVSLLLLFPSATRANGFLNVGFSLYKMANILGDALVPAFFSLLLGIFPFVFTQWYAFMNFCRLTKSDRNTSRAIIDYARFNPELKLPSDDPQPGALISSPFHIPTCRKPIGTPIFILIMGQGLRFLQRHRSYSKKLGLTPFVESIDLNRLLASGNLPKEAFVYVIHSLALGAFCALFVHIQVSTRILCSSCPILYWYAALLSMPKDRKHTPLIESCRMDGLVHIVERRENLESAFKCVLLDERPRDERDRWLRFYFVGYAVLGTVLFSNFLPWT